MKPRSASAARRLIPFAGAERALDKKPARMPPKASKRETVEPVYGDVVYFSDDHWRTIWWRFKGEALSQRLKDRNEIDRIRYIAICQYGGGRDD